MEQASRQLILADHLLTATYPLTKDPKLLIGVLHNMHKAQDDIMLATIAFFSPKQILPSTSSFSTKVTKFQLAIKDKHLASIQEVNMLTTTNNLFEKHEQSTIEFARKANMVFADGVYKLDVLKQTQLKTILTQTRILFKKLLLAVNYS